MDLARTLTSGQDSSNLIFLRQAFMSMDFIHVAPASKKGAARLSAKADLWFYAAITLPLMIMTFGGWLLWNARLKTQRSTPLDIEADAVFVERVGKTQRPWE